MSKVLVTGHKGFIGRNLFVALKEYGFNVEGLDAPDDIGDFTECGFDCDCIVHLAAFAGIRASIEKPDIFWDNNVTKSKPIFSYCAENNVRLLFASSSSVAEWWKNPYATTKKVNEAQAPANSVAMRFFTVYAEKSRSDMLYDMLKHGRAEYLTNHYRDWIHVDDVCSAIITLLENEFTGPIDIGTGKPTSVIELGKKMGASHLPIKESPPNEMIETCADTATLVSMGWQPTKNILEDCGGC